ncbi:MAG TPA: hypothetical protein VMA77_10185 [Solirubrobacteraceae bacterium]|nr:hypothetical protein [Solirubrobacteraceae bacterium]
MRIPNCKLLITVTSRVAARFLIVAVLAAAAASPAAARTTDVHASGWWRGAPGEAVFVQTDNVAGNSIAVYDRAPDGTLASAGTYPTGGLGGILGGAGADHLASQGSLVLDRTDGLLYAVNAGSNTVSMFAVHGDQLALLQVISSGGTFPVSIAVHGDIVYVLNARNGASVQGYVRVGDRLVEVPGWQRNLGLDQNFQNTSTEFLHSPGQVVFTPDGSQLLVSTKDNTNAIDVFSVDRWGDLAPTPVVNGAGSIPFAMTFDRSGHLVVTETGTSSIVSFDVQPDGVLAPVSTVATGQAASCWITAVRPDLLYVSNAGSASETGISDQAGHLAALGNTSTDPGTIDATGTPDGRYLYVQTGTNGVLDEFAVNPSGALAEIGSVAVGGEGIAAS